MKPEIRGGKIFQIEGPDGRVWRKEGPEFWHCHEDGTVISDPNELDKDGRTKAELRWEKLLSEI